MQRILSPFSTACCDVAHMAQYGEFATVSEHTTTPGSLCASSDTIPPMPMQQSYQRQRSLHFIRFSWGRLILVLVVVVAAGIFLAGRQLTRPSSGNIRQQLDSA